MAKIEIESAYVDKVLVTGQGETFALKLTEKHDRKDEQSGEWVTESRTFRTVKVGRKHGIDLSVFSEGDRVQVFGFEKTEVREHQGKKFYDLVVWANRIEHLASRSGGSGASSAPSGHSGTSGWSNGAQTGGWASGGGGGDDFTDPAPF